MQGRVFQKLLYRVPFLDTTIIIINGHEGGCSLMYNPDVGSDGAVPCSSLGGGAEMLWGLSPLS